MLSDSPFLLSVKNGKPFPAAFQQRLQVCPYVHAHMLGWGEKERSPTRVEKSRPSLLDRKLRKEELIMPKFKKTSPTQSAWRKATEKNPHPKTMRIVSQMWVGSWWRSWICNPCGAGCEPYRRPQSQLWPVGCLLETASPPLFFFFFLNCWEIPSLRSKRS